MSKYIKVYEDHFDPQVLHEILELVYKERSAENADFVIQKKDIPSQWLNKFNYIEEKALELAKTYLRHTYNKLPISALGVNHIGFKTDPEGAFTELHYDWEMNRIGNDILMKPMVALVYLSDVEEGGDCFFPLEDVTVKPKKGRIVIFPCCFAFPHVTIPVAKGKKELMRITFGMDLDYYKSEKIEF